MNSICKRECLGVRVIEKETEKSRFNVDFLNYQKHDNNKSAVEWLSVVNMLENHLI